MEKKNMKHHYPFPFHNIVSGLNLKGRKTPVVHLSPHSVVILFHLQQKCSFVIWTKAEGILRSTMPFVITKKVPCPRLCKATSTGSCWNRLPRGVKNNYNIASKFVKLNSIAWACFIFLLCTLMTTATKSLENFVINQKIKFISTHDFTYRFFDQSKTRSFIA